MTTRGYFSAVEDRNDNTRLLIRARCETDIRALNDLVPGEPYANGGTDYPWRLSCTKGEWTKALITLASEIRYTNFKDSVRSTKHQAAYMQVWRTLLSLEERIGRLTVGNETVDPDPLVGQKVITIDSQSPAKAKRTPRRLAKRGAP